ncbi:5376_t:CDS:1, partial [Gigaspora margarita]
MSQTNEDITLTRNRQSSHHNNTTITQASSPDITHPVHFLLEPLQLLKIITYNVQDLG